MAEITIKQYYEGEEGFLIPSEYTISFNSAEKSDLSGLFGKYKALYVDAGENSVDVRVPEDPALIHVVLNEIDEMLSWAKSIDGDFSDSSKDIICSFSEETVEDDKSLEYYPVDDEIRMSFSSDEEKSLESGNFSEEFSDGSIVDESIINESSKESFSESGFSEENLENPDDDPDYDYLSLEQEPIEASEGPVPDLSELDDSLESELSPFGDELASSDDESAFELSPDAEEVVIDEGVITSDFTPDLSELNDSLESELSPFGDELSSSDDESAFELSPDAEEVVIGEGVITPDFTPDLSELDDSLESELSPFGDELASSYDDLAFELSLDSEEVVIDEGV
ncbi:MAG: hypothetical protein PHI15_05020, partial [Methanomicrobium sp.]|nr:hypothetical protein [Methanomicrobium sp.]